MDKPLKPKKPLKNQEPPAQFETIKKVIMVNYKTKELVLVDEKYRNTENRAEEMPQYEVDNLENFGEGLKYSDVLKFKQLLPPEIQDFTIEESSNYDGYYDYTYLTYRQAKTLEQYQKELNEFNNRFNKYEKALVLYEAKLKIYEDWRRSQKLAKLQKEIETLTVVAA